MISRDILYELDPAYYGLIFSYDKVFANEFEILQKKKKNLKDYEWLKILRQL